MTKKLLAAAFSLATLSFGVVAQAQTTPAAPTTTAAERSENRQTDRQQIRANRAATRQADRASRQADRQKNISDREATHQENVK